MPSEDSSGNFNQADVCQGKFGTPPPHPPTPYGPQNANSNPATLVEDGFKSVRGYLTEGRFLTFEMNGYALTTRGNQITATKATATHSNIQQRWIVHATGGTAVVGGEGAGTFVLTSAVDKRSFAGNMGLSNEKSSGEVFTITDMGNGLGYSLKMANGQFLSINRQGKIGAQSMASGFQVFSVTYRS
jgi:phospholipase C